MTMLMVVIECVSDFSSSIYVSVCLFTYLYKLRHKVDAVNAKIPRAVVLYNTSTSTCTRVQDLSTCTCTRT